MPPTVVARCSRAHLFRQHTRACQKIPQYPGPTPHLLRLSALPPPSSPSEEASMLKTLSCQIHFVKQVQQVDTTGVTPLRSIRDETDEAHKENTINIERLRDSLEREEFVGRNRRIRRRRPDKMEHPDEGSWEEKDALLKSASKMMGKFFVVQSSEAKAE
uniref:Glutamyl-tRNA amidotransferase complex subunit Gta3 domain-containing protein n=1 Tax=Coccidioides posadasii RMSCC 3488 TaxID=454284 RepID=A0A0J6FK22_COCPO|nr:hypothetical protein CPAG_06974 [Coccidioides posadasii RMSCC 3488]